MCMAQISLLALLFNASREEVFKDAQRYDIIIHASIKLDFDVFFLLSGITGTSAKG